MVTIHTAIIKTKKNKLKKLIGIKFKVFINDSQKSPSELSGGQKSILALSFIFSLLIFKTTPFYILDEVDTALDFYYTKK